MQEVFGDEITGYVAPSESSEDERLNESDGDPFMSGSDCTEDT